MPAASSASRCSGCRRSARIAGVDRRVERLHPAVEDLREARDRADVGHRQAGVAQRPGRAAGRDELEADGRRRPAAELDEAGLVADREERAARRRQCRVGAGRRRATCRRPSTSTAPASSSATARGSSRCSTALIRSWSVASSSPARDGDGLLRTIGPPSSVSSTTWTVQPVTFAPCASASRTAWPPGKRRQQRRMGVQDPAGERRERRRARRCACSPRARRRRLEPRQRRGERASASARAAGSVAARPGSERGLDPLLRRPGERRARPIREDEPTSPPSSPRRAAATSARRLLPAPETPTATRPSRADRPAQAAHRAAAPST